MGEYVAIRMKRDKAELLIKSYKFVKRMADSKGMTYYGLLPQFFTEFERLYNEGNGNNGNDNAKGNQVR